jgi:hypothetical protein
VTNLLNPRHAFYRIRYPDIEISLERREAMLAGSGFHEGFIRRVSGEAFVEQSVNFQDITGRIDIYEGYPLELKTTSSTLTAEEIVRSRPSYLEQLGMYCAMVDKGLGHILLYNRGGDQPLVGFDAEFDNLSDIKKEMLRRRNLLQEALKTGNPVGLPPCPFANSGCIFLKKGICGCDTMMPPSFPIAGLAKIRPNPALGQEFARRFTAWEREEITGIPVNDIVYPRRAFHRGFGSEEEDNRSELRSGLEVIDKLGFNRELIFKALAGHPGELIVQQIDWEGIRGRVNLHEGRVTRITKSGFSTPAPRYNLASAFPDRLLRLGFDCALVNKGRARLIIYYPKVEPDEAKLIVYDMTFDHLDSLRREMHSRRDLIQAAKISGKVDDLPKCPAWMCKFCKHASKCG